MELFAGSRSIGKVAEQLGMEVFSVDWKNYKNIDLKIDVENLKTADIPFVLDIVWASPDCATYSVAALRYHRNGIIPKSEYALKCDRVNQHLIYKRIIFKKNLGLSPSSVHKSKYAETEVSSISISSTSMY